MPKDIRYLQDDDFITVPQMAVILALSKARCYQLLQARKIRHVVFGERAVRIRYGDLRKWCEAMTIEPTPAEC